MLLMKLKMLPITRCNTQRRHPSVFFFSQFPAVSFHKKAALQTSRKVQGGGGKKRSGLNSGKCGNSLRNSCRKGSICTVEVAVLAQLLTDSSEMKVVAVCFFLSDGRVLYLVCSSLHTL